MKRILLFTIIALFGITIFGCSRFTPVTTTTTQATTTTTTASTTSGTTVSGQTTISESTTTEALTTTSWDKVTISYWNPLTGADGVVMRQLVQMFNEEYEGRIEVAETFQAEIDYYTNLNLLTPMGRGPDVAIMHSYLVQSYANRGIIVPIDNYIESSQVDVNPNDYIQDVVNSLYFESDLYGIPLDMHVVGIYYNKDLLNKYSLSVPTNRAELLAAAHTVQNGEDALGNTVWGLPISAVWPSEWIFTTSLYQNNGDELDSEGMPAYNSVEGKTALRALTDLVHTEHLSPLNLSVDQDLFYFQTGKALFHIQGSWMLNSMVESEINFGVLPMSNMFNSDGEEYSEYIAARSHTFVIPYSTKTVTDAKKIAVMTFIKYLGDHSYVWATAGQIPASNIARATAEYQALEHHPGFGDVENFRVAEASPYYHEAYSPIYSRVTSAMLNANYNIDELFSGAVTEAMQLIQEAQG
ncbi:MAG: extracellular solute-binding protein [Bacilli bacterium]|nr:extracellular solute-binding protein [Bacilli bacterium]